MKEENKKNKKKILLTYLILAACLLVIAAVTVTVVLTVTRKPADNIIDSNQPGGDKDDDKNPGGNTGDDDDNNGDDDNKDDQPTLSPDKFVLPVASATVSTKYDFVYDETLDRYCVHQGMDFAGKAGDSVSSVLDGKVTKIVSDHILGENYITISHANGIETTYKYITAKENLKEGDTIKRGETIGVIATAAGMEMKQGDHLHFEISVNGKTADPDTYLDIIEK